MKLRLFLYFFFFLFSFPIWSQKWVKQGHQQFQQMAYSEAIISLEKAVEKGHKNAKIYSQLADSYYFNANYSSSVKWYKLLFKTKDKILPVHYFRYAQSLKSVGKYEEADEVLKKMPNNSVGENTQLINEIIKNSGRYQISSWGFNTFASEFGTSYNGNQIVFASSRDTTGVLKKNHSWTNQSFTDLYIVNPDSVSEKPIKFSKKINSKVNESTAVFTKDGLTMYFTRNNFDPKKGINKKKSSLLKIYKAVKKDADWEVVGALPFCDDTYNVAHPALNYDETKLYFVSDMPGGYGETDLYSVTILPNGKFDAPENLGTTINTIGRETFPFISKNNDLYFASDGHYSLGGLDVFVSTIEENNVFSAAKNIGKPVNSPMDDFGFIINEDTKTGYFTSNRVNGLGLDDIYVFEELLPLPCETILTGIVQAENSVLATSDVEVVLLDEKLNPIEKSSIDEKGIYSFKVDCKKKYSIRISSKDFISDEIVALTTNFSVSNLPLINLKKQTSSFQIGDDLAKILSINPIYFDLGKSIIRPDASAELQKIKIFLQENPTIAIDIRSHTDSRDTFKNNQILSAARAQATLNWFVENGIDASRLSGIGLGETQLLNECADKVACSEAQHQLNRRSEFIIIAN